RLGERQVRGVLLHADERDVEPAGGGGAMRFIDGQDRGPCALLVLRRRKAGLFDRESRLACLRRKGCRGRKRDERGEGRYCAERQARKTFCAKITPVLYDGLAASHVSPPGRSETTLDCEQLTGRLSQARNGDHITPRSANDKIARGSGNV